jgi:hypothetical protein
MDLILVSSSRGKNLKKPDQPQPVQPQQVQPQQELRVGSMELGVWHWV